MKRRGFSRRLPRAKPDCRRRLGRACRRVKSSAEDRTGSAASQSGEGQTVSPTGTAFGVTIFDRFYQGGQPVRTCTQTGRSKGGMARSTRLACRLSLRARAFQIQASPWICVDIAPSPPVHRSSLSATIFVSPASCRNQGSTPDGYGKNL